MFLAYYDSFFTYFVSKNDFLKLCKKRCFCSFSDSRFCFNKFTCSMKVLFSSLCLLCIIINNKCFPRRQTARSS